MKIGIISDTHNKLNPKILDIFQNIPVIIHAGDVGSAMILHRLKSIPGVETVYAVLGNTDDPWELSGVPIELELSFDSHNILVRHILTSPQSFLTERRKAKKEMPEIVIFGHTHEPYFKKIDDVYFLNPGSATSPRHVQYPSVAILALTSTAPDVDFVELGP